MQIKLRQKTSLHDSRCLMVQKGCATSMNHEKAGFLFPSRCRYYIPGWSLGGDSHNTEMSIQFVFRSLLPIYLAL